ncbi:MAG: hypothetical protein WC749_06920 [Dehalococcoidia bacterium]
MTDINKAIDSAIEKVIRDFQEHPEYYFTEEDVRWRLMREIEDALTKLDCHQVKIKSGVTLAVHGEYPTPFRCSMKQRSFEPLPKDSKGQRGHFDIVVLNPLATAICELEVVRSQYYRLFLGDLPKLPLPFLDCVIEIKLFRDLAHTNRTESAKQQAEYAVQAIKKVAETLKATTYYSKPFAKRGLVLLFDNSALVPCSVSYFA